MANDLSIIDPMQTIVGDVNGYISARLMASYKLDKGHIIHVGRVAQGSDGRIRWHYVLEHDGMVVFEGSDLGTPPDWTYGEAARSIMGWLTLRPGDTDDEHFDDYTDAQVAWRDEHAEDLSYFGIEPES